MASTYAHYKFGNEIIKQLDEEVQDIIIKHIDIFNIGLHGPDILFYYKPLRENKINTIGYKQHNIEAIEFMNNARIVINNELNKEEYIAYSLGFICHFALDRTVHSYIEYMIQTSGATHTEIESELDRELLIKDGINPYTKNLAEHIKNKNVYNEIISKFWENVSSENISKALKTMYSDNKLLVCNNKLKRMFVKLVLLLSGNYKEMHGQIISEKGIYICKKSTENLLIKFEEAEKLAVILINDFCKKLYTDLKLEDRFDRHFSFYEEEIEDYKNKEKNQ